MECFLYIIFKIEKLKNKINTIMLSFMLKTFQNYV
jgi:hypothetical protein